MIVPGKMYGCITTGHFTPFAPESRGTVRDDFTFMRINEPVMDRQRNNRNKWLHIRLTEAEYKKINAGFSRSTKRKISEYARGIMLDKPITVYTRNQSFDDFVAEVMLLRSELKAIGNNFNQAVKKLHTAGSDAEIKAWALLNENSKQLFFKKADEIYSKIAQIIDQWSQE
jgi:hypothetical protein